MIRTAIGLGLRFPPSISDNALANLIDRADPTEYQMRCLEAFLKPHGRTPPLDMTYGKARKILAQASESLNRYAIEALQLEEGNIRAREDEYYYILSIFGDQLLYKVQIQAVRLARSPSASMATFTPKSRPKVIHPHEMLYLSMPVDLKTWYPPGQQPQINARYDEEPDF